APSPAASVEESSCLIVLHPIVGRSLCRHVRDGFVRADLTPGGQTPWVRSRRSRTRRPGPLGSFVAFLPVRASHQPPCWQGLGCFSHFARSDKLPLWLHLGCSLGFF